MSETPEYDPRQAPELPEPDHSPLQRPGASMLDDALPPPSGAAPRRMEQVRDEILDD